MNSQTNRSREIQPSIVHLFEPEATPEDEINRGTEGARKLVLPSAERNGFSMTLIASSDVVLLTGSNPKIYFENEDLLATRRCFTVGRSSANPAAARYLTAIYEAILASDSILLNDSILRSESLERDKLALAAHASKLGVRVIPTISVPFGPYAQRCLKLAENTNSEAWILKPREMGSGQAVLKVESLQQLRAAIDIAAQTGHAYVVQPWLKNEGDLRVYVMGDEIFASVLRKPKAGGYLANLSKGGRHEGVTVSAELRENCLKISKSLQARYLVIDWLVTPDGYVLNEWTTALAGFGLSEEIADRFFTWVKSEITRASNLYAR